MKHITHILIFLFLLLFTRTLGQTIDSLTGPIYSYKWIDLPITGMHYEQANNYLEKVMEIEKNTFTLFSDTFRHVQYSFQKWNKLEFFRVFGHFDYKKMGIKEDSILVLTVITPASEFHAPQDIIISRDFLITEYLGFFFFFHRNLGNQGGMGIISGDTVRCLYNEDKSCTGFVIQGSRKKGKVIHVNPQNKNVPLELEGK